VESDFRGEPLANFIQLVIVTDPLARVVNGKFRGSPRTVSVTIDLHTTCHAKPVYQNVTTDQHSRFEF
jgi:hypothetical protein